MMTAAYVADCAPVVQSITPRLNAGYLSSVLNTAVENLTRGELRDITTVMDYLDRTGDEDITLGDLLR